MLPARAAAYEQLFVPQYGARAAARPVSLVTRRSCSSSWSRHASAPLGKLQPAKDICCVPGTLRTCENRYFDVARLQLQVLLPQKSAGREGEVLVGELLLATCHTRSLVCLQLFACVWLHNSSNMEIYVFPLRNNQSLQQQQHNRESSMCYSSRRFRCDSDSIRFD